ncbi:hypothetical protein AAC387_Pa02g5103 [Persea americana]
MGERIPEVVLNSGEKIPMLGLGTSSSPVPHDLLISSFIDAIETGLITGTSTLLPFMGARLP